MLSFLLSTVQAQGVAPGVVNATAPASCQTQATQVLGALTQVCGGPSSPLLFSTNPIAGLPSLSTPSNVAAFCSDACRSRVLAFAAPACANSVIITGSNAVGPAAVIRDYQLENKVLCFKDKGGNYCLNEIYQSVVKSGYTPGNSETLANAFLKFAGDKKLACTTCAIDFSNNLSDNLDGFGSYQTIVNSLQKSIKNTCDSSNVATVFSLAATLTVMMML
jgi:hypothetical protein